MTKHLESLLSQLKGGIDILQMEKRIRGHVRCQMEKSQHEYYLNEQTKAIQKGLGEGEEGADLKELNRKVKAVHTPKETKKKVESEPKKLKLMSSTSAETTIICNYIGTLVGLPWHRKSRVNNDLLNAKQVLDQNHYSLEEVKERILEYLTVQQRVGKLRAPILCLVRSPGVDKTSLRRSAVCTTSRKPVRMALGGMRDETKIHSRHRTCIGSIPGKALQSLTKVGVRDPLFLLDEIDKMGADFRDDSSSTLLEVLDPERNHTFQNHYIEVNFNLSDVISVAVSNSLNTLAPLLDRMEVIRLSDYMGNKKVDIARRYLLFKQIEDNGLKEDEIGMTEAALCDIIRYYTREAGIHSLGREVSKICHGVVRQLLLKKEASTSVKVDSDNLGKFLGMYRFDSSLADKGDQVSQMTGLVWTEVGGGLLTIEAALMPGEDNVIRTGSLGDAMKESVGVMCSVMRLRPARLNIEDEMFEKHGIHIHMPEGAAPRDDSLAGITITAALVSVLTRIPARVDMAMTDEITLRGETLPIGGLKEGLLATHRGDIKLALTPEENVKDLADTPNNVKSNIEIQPVRWINKVLGLTLVRKPEPLPEGETKPAPTQDDDGKPWEMVHH